MISLKRWFFLYGVLPFLAGVAVFAVIGVLFIGLTMQTHLEALEKNVDELTKILSIANKQKSQEVHDLAFNSFLFSNAVKSISYCSSRDILFEWPLGSHDCTASKSGLFVVTKNMPHSREAKIVVEFSKVPIVKSLFPLLIAYLAFILLAIVVGTKLRQRLSNDLLSIVTVDVDEQSGSKKFRNYKPAFFPPSPPGGSG